MSVMDCKRGLILFFTCLCLFSRSLMRLISSVRSGAPGNPNRKKKKWDFTPLLTALKYFSSLVFSQLCAAGDGCKNLRHIFIYKPILLEKNKTKQNKTKLNSSSATLCDPWVFSSRLELAVVCGVIFRSGLHYIFVSVWKSKKKMVLEQNFTPLNSQPLSSCVYQ